MATALEIAQIISLPVNPETTALRESAREKLVAGEPLTTEEAAVLVGL